MKKNDLWPQLKTKPIAALCCFIMGFNMACSSEGEKNMKKNMTTLQPKVESIWKAKAQLGEGAIWDYQRQLLWWVDIEGMKLHSLAPESGKRATFTMPDRIGTVVPTKDGRLAVALHSGVELFNPADSSFQQIAHPEKARPANRYNDGKCDPAGRLWVGSMHLQQEKGAASLFKIEGNGAAEIMIDSVTISNGIVWTADQRTMYYIDTPTLSVKAFDFNATTGQITGGRLAFTIPKEIGSPDGSTLDAEGMLWIAHWGGSCIARWNPETGELLQKITVPAKNVTSCAFGGPMLDVLYITTASVGMTDEETQKYPEAGSLFAVKPGVKGVKANYFAWKGQD